MWRGFYPIRKSYTQEMAHIEHRPLTQYNPVSLKAILYNYQRTIMNNQDYDLYAQLETDLYSQIEDIDINDIITKPEVKPIELKVKTKSIRKPLGE